MMLLSSLIGILITLCTLLVNQPGKGDLCSTGDRNMKRGVTAVRADSSRVFISWRFLCNDPSGIKFNLFRDGVKINTKPITGATCYTDVTRENHSYSVQPAGTSLDKFSEKAVTVWDNGYLRIPLKRPPGGEINGRPFTYSPGDASVADLDGDGAYEIVLKWDPSNARDNASDGFSGNVLIDAMEFDGTLLWRIDLGRNIRAGAHYIQMMVFDLDSDGKAELVCKTADGTVDGTGVAIGNPDSIWVNGRGKIVKGPEFLTLFDGISGKAVSTVPYIPGRGNICNWGNNECNGNRVDRFLACIAYLDGINPSVVMCRGYYGRLTICAWDYKNKGLEKRWLFDSDEGFAEYMGQGNHNLAVGDVDNDGKDEIVYGSSLFDHDGKPVYTTGMGHGDAMHLADIDPYNPGLEVWGVKETGGWGGVLHDAATGKILMSVPADGDTGRGLAADLYPQVPGHEMWSSSSKGIYSSTGQKITSFVPSVNFRIYWDGDLQDELLDRSFIDKWDPVNHKPVRLLDASVSGGRSINGSKATPVLSADLFGDWREEVIFRSEDNESLLVYSTTIPTTYRIRTLMSDRVYRLSVAWQNVVYNQPPHTGISIENDKSVREFNSR